eukprot:953464-Pleurochrysis_carterae.AAC.1
MQHTMFYCARAIIHPCNPRVDKCRKLLTKYSVVECRELHCIWDFRAWLEPHMHRFGSFATGNFGDGMHEFLLRKDGEGV